MQISCWLHIYFLRFLSTYMAWWTYICYDCSRLLYYSLYLCSSLLSLNSLNSLSGLILSSLNSFSSSTYFTYFLTCYLLNIFLCCFRFILFLYLLFFWLRAYYLLSYPINDIYNLCHICFWYSNLLCNRYMWNFSKFSTW